MSEIYVRTFDASSGTGVPSTDLRTESPRAAVGQARHLNRMYREPAYITRIHFSGNSADPAFLELSHLAHEHGLRVHAKAESWTSGR